MILRLLYISKYLKVVNQAKKLLDKVSFILLHEPINIIMTWRARVWTSKNLVPACGSKDSQPVPPPTSPHPSMCMDISTCVVQFSSQFLQAAASGSWLNAS